MDFASNPRQISLHMNNSAETSLIIFVPSLIKLISSVLLHSFIYDTLNYKSILLRIRMIILFLAGGILEVATNHR